VFNGLVATDGTFQIDNTNIDSSKGRVVNGVLVVFDTESVFNTVAAIDIQCTSAQGIHSGLVFLMIFLPPIITGGTIVNEGNGVVLNCDTTNSRPRPSVQWFNPAGQLVSTERMLIVLVILRNQTGVYTCVANQPNTGLNMSSTVDVIVQFAPDVTADRVGLVDVPLGGTLELSCSILGVPPPNSISWTLNGTELLDMPPDVTIENTTNSTTLTVSDVEEDEGGVYQCTAGNVVNENSATTNVRIQLPPGPPTNFQVTGQTNVSLDLSWTNPDFNGFSPIASYRVQVIASGNTVGFSRDLNVPAGATQGTLTLLDPFTQYTLRLFVTNEVGLEGDFDETTGMTLSNTPPKVQNLNAVAESSTEILVSWEEPDFNPNTTDAPDGYRVSFAPTTGGQRTTNETLATQFSLLLEDLMMGTEYTITVIGLNSVDGGLSVSEGAPSDVIEATNIDPPSMPRDFNGNSPNPFTITVSWTEPETNGGRPIIRYVLTITDGDTISLDVGIPLTHRFVDLQQNTTYQISITAVNIDVEGGNVERESQEASITVTTMPVGPPQVPDTPSVISITNTTATVTWNDPGGFPTLYTVEVKERLEDWTDETVMRTNTTDLSLVLTDLEPLTRYDARVRSRNFNGFSEFSQEAQFSTFGRIAVTGSNGTVVSGTTVILMCTQEVVDSNTAVEYMWTREGGRPLPEGFVVTNGQLEIIDAQEGDSGVYICSANGVQGRISLTIEDSPSGVSTTVIIIAASAGGGALILFLIVVFLAVFCLCCRGNSDNSPTHKRRSYSFRLKHWAESSGSHSLPKTQQRKEVTNSFHMPDDYTSHTSFNTGDRIRRSPSPPSHRAAEGTHAGAEPTTSFQLK
jgi:hypothetical protein